MKNIGFLVVSTTLLTLSNTVIAGWGEATYKQACFSCHGTGQVQETTILPPAAAFEAGIPSGITEHYNVRQYLTQEKENNQSK